MTDQEFYKALLQRDLEADKRWDRFNSISSFLIGMSCGFLICSFIQLIFIIIGKI